MLSRRLVGVVAGVLIAVGAAAWIIGCSASIGTGPGGGISVSLTIGGTTITLNLGQGGFFAVQPNTMVRNVVDLQPFQSPPADTPATGAVRLRSSSVTVLPSGASSKWAVTAQLAISGTARLRAAIDTAGAASPCDTGIDLGTFDIVVENGVVTTVGPGLAMSLSAVDYFRRNDLSLCLEVTADFDATLQIEGLDVTFGPSQSGAEDGLRATFERRNLDAQNIHILPPGETFSDDNRITPNVPKNAIIDGLDINGLVTFRAGRNEELLDSVICPPVRYSAYVAIVEWNGSDLRCYEPEPGPITEACCLPPLPGYESYDQTYAQSISCVDIGSLDSFRTREDCRFFGGMPQGVGTTCASVTCNEPFSACCIGESCAELSFEDCTDLGGIFQGTGIHCDSVSCAPAPPPDPGPGPGPDTDEACCLPDGSCDEGDVVACQFAQGTPQGPGSRCATTSCPQVPGACCATDETCSEVTEDQCRTAGGAFQGGGTLCANADCDLGACCWGNEQCTQTSEDICAGLDGGRFQGNDTSCDTNPCAEGACCYNNQCTMTTAEICAELPGQFLGDDTDCDPDPCADFVVWYTGNVCCWGAPLLYISDRNGFEASESTCSYPGGGLDCNNPLVKVELQGGFATVEAAEAWLCPQFVSFSYHYWCNAHYQMDGKNWQPGVCDLSGLPETTTPPDVNGCQ